MSSHGAGPALLAHGEREPTVRRIGITGHQGLDKRTERAVRERLAVEIARRGRICAIGSLAEGADQIFAEEALGHNGTLVTIIPSAGYEKSFSDPNALVRYRCLRDQSSEVIQLDHASPGEDAYSAAGQKVVDLSDEMFAVWDGQPSVGLGGTADIAAYARQQDVPVMVIWPPGSSRA